MMRKSVFLKELKFVFESNKVVQLVQEKIESALFSNYPTSSPYYILKETIRDRADIENVINSFAPGILTPFLDVFIVSDDLVMPLPIKRLFQENNKIALFVGAGVSKLCGLPLWNELGEKAINYLYEELELINNFEYATIIRNFHDPKTKLSIFHEILSKANPKAIGFYEKELNPKQDPNKVLPANPYDLLVEFERPIITSNIDNKLKESLQNLQNKIISLNVKNNVSQGSPTVVTSIHKGFDQQTLVKPGIPYQIHGNLEDISSAILTTEDYLRNYKVGSGLREFLENLFIEYTVVFIGYGLEEFEILEYVITENKKEDKKHYALIPLFLNEINLLSVYKRYLSKLNISVQPYYLDFGYKRLISVLGSWLDSVKSYQTLPYLQSLAELDKGGL